MIHSSTFEFLSNLASNNHKEWFDENRSDYEAAKENMLEVVDQLLDGLSEHHPEMASIRPKDCLFRINRDIRFSKNKAPYKVNMGAYMNPGGKKSPLPGYYLHIQPGDCFVGGGIYKPAAEHLKLIRSHIEQYPDELRAIMKSEDFVSTFGEIRGEELKSAPKGYPKDHPDIDLLRKKGFTGIKSFADTSTQDPQFVQQALNDYQALYRLNDYLAEALQTA
ncbi:DUF2461 domain-containing protein [Pontibacter sp. G13]|uniref:DUF2461 domain-containing protein n=1 Tax=Pontibacter sp. G13 TaxID=3074898 RepID=UPI00288AC5B0|nr:DUF2461 domain-containing protein [Pontibacter sp. G13]WNJ21441.1 DUF2461 domain-containing protein [Pontibacter sp. G13]